MSLLAGIFDGPSATSRRGVFHRCGLCHSQALTVYSACSWYYPRGSACAVPSVPGPSKRSAEARVVVQRVPLRFPPCWPRAPPSQPLRCPSGWRCLHTPQISGILLEVQGRLLHSRGSCYFQGRNHCRPLVPHRRPLAPHRRPLVPHRKFLVVYCRPIHASQTPVVTRH